MLGAAWVACGWTVHRFAVPGDARSRLLMGSLVFAMLMTAELALTIFALNGSVASHFAAYGTTAPLLGLAGQLAFAFLPLLTHRSSRKAP